ncbi:E3 ubiquitin-protein ligase RNF185-like isoform X2 [Chenopodium quinoa]|nr:E3 ubiquitin-protein ligase RNF185-like isoform X2 [Chenopodium quinoa]
MESGFEESMKAESSSSNGEAKDNNNNNKDNNDAGDFECNICFELAQDPIVTLCGHLYCWPCLYRWLRYHSQSHECPVCKALVQEDKLVPLYGRGKSNTDPRSRPVPGIDIPNRPSGQRPETAPTPPGPEQSYFSNLGFGLFGGFMPMATARFGNMTMSAGFGGLFPSLLSLQFNGFPHNPMYGTAHGFPYAYPQAVHGNAMHHGHGYEHGHGFQQHHHGGVATPASQRQDYILKNLCLIIGFCFLVAML